ncbi:hypothetical protein N7490_011222 [Penicillium lividum]|nr:hypothetical protein N7490_011222 [Penicillium lividum]
MAPKQAKADSRALTLLFKKHKITILLSLQPHESLAAVKNKLLEALNSREIHQINGEPIPDDPTYIDFGIPVDRSELEKGWTRIGKAATTNSGSKQSTGRTGDTVLATGLENGHIVAFRFRKPDEVEKDAENDELEMDADQEEGWDVILPSFDDEEEEL